MGRILSLTLSLHHQLAPLVQYPRCFIPFHLSVSINDVSDLLSSYGGTSSNFIPDFLATGVVILISIAIGAGFVFLLALIGILWTLFSRNDEKLNKLDSANDEDDDSTNHRPSSLLEHINAATRTTILGAGAHNQNTEKENATRDADPFGPGPDGSNYVRAETPSDAVGGMLAEETSRPAHARYSFDGTGEGELPISAGTEVEVLDDRDPAYVHITRSTILFSNSSQHTGGGTPVTSEQVERELCLRHTCIRTFIINILAVQFLHDLVYPQIPLDFR